jgi:hypothetical protein
LSLKRLTDLTIRALPIPEKGQRVYYEPTGLRIRVSQGGSKTFVTQLGSKRKRVSIGKYPQISLSEARKELLRLQIQVDDAPQKNTPQRLSETLTAYLNDCEAKNKPATILEYRRMLSLLPNKPLPEITRADLPNPTAHRIMACRIFFNWCIKQQLVDRNPFNHIPTKIGKRDRVLSDNELKVIWHYNHR